MAVWDISIAIGVILLSFVSAYTGFKVDETHPFLKMFFIATSIFFLVLGNAFMPIILDMNNITNSVLITRVDLAYKIISFSLMFALVYFMVYFIYIFLKSIKKRSGVDLIE